MEGYTHIASKNLQGDRKPPLTAIMRIPAVLSLVSHPSPRMALSLLPCTRQKKRARRLWAHLQPLSLCGRAQKVSETLLLKEYNFMRLTFTVTSRLIWDAVPQPPTSSSRSPNGLKLKFKPFEGLTQEMQYLLSKDMMIKGNLTSDSITCDVVSLTCSVEDLLPGRAYSFKLKACFTPKEGENLCGESTPAVVDWTRPSSELFSEHPLGC